MFWRVHECNFCLIKCVFFSTFLIRIGKEVFPQDKDYVIELLDDVFFYIKQGSNLVFNQENKFGRNDVSYDEYFNMLEPFFITGFETLAENL